MKKVSIGYSNFWGSAEHTAEYFYRMFPALRGEYDIRIESDNPDVMLYSVYDYINKLAPYSCRVLISCEGGGDHFAEGGKLSPGVYDPHFFDYGLTASINNTHPNHIYLPPPYINVNLFNDGVYNALVYRKNPYPKISFCNFIYSNPNSQDRRLFRNLLAEYKPIDCPGPVDTNCVPIRFTGYNQYSYLQKQEYQAICKFSLAFENCYYPGYTTEKLSDPFVARSVPIYFGNPDVGKIFNKDAFIDVRDWDSWGDAIEWIKQVNENEYLYNKYLEAPVFKDNTVPECFCDHTYLLFFRHIFG